MKTLNGKAPTVVVIDIRYLIQTHHKIRKTHKAATVLSAFGTSLPFVTRSKSNTCNSENGLLYYLAVFSIRFIAVSL